MLLLVKVIKTQCVQVYTLLNCISFSLWDQILQISNN